MQSVAVITGGASGIGRACALRMANEGHAVAILDLQIDAGRETVELIRAQGGNAGFFECNVADHNSIAQAARQVEDTLGETRVLVTCAGLIPHAESILDLDVERHDRLWQVNYHGTLHSCRIFGRLMRDRRQGAIVTLGSINSLRPMPLPAYNVSKVAVHRLTELLAMELGPHGVRANCVGPTFVMTEGLQQKIAEGKRDLSVMLSQQALDALPTPDDIADAVAFLCSKAAARITGVLLPIDAGWTPGVSYYSYAGGLPWVRT